MKKRDWLRLADCFGRPTLHDVEICVLFAVRLEHLGDHADNKTTFSIHAPVQVVYSQKTLRRLQRFNAGNVSIIVC